MSGYQDAPFSPEQTADMWGGWTLEQMLREHFSGLRCTQLGIDVRRHGTLYAILPGDPPVVSLDPDIMQYVAEPGAHPGAYFWRFTPAASEGGGYVVERVDSIPDGARTLSFRG
jgi:hypothetical protein